MHVHSLPYPQYLEHHQAHSRSLISTHWENTGTSNTDCTCACHTPGSVRFHTHTHRRTHAHVHTRMGAHTHRCTHARVHTRTGAHTHRRTHLSTMDLPIAICSINPHSSSLKIINPVLQMGELRLRERLCDFSVSHSWGFRFGTRDS